VSPSLWHAKPMADIKHSIVGTLPSQIRRWARPNFDLHLSNDQTQQHPYTPDFMRGHDLPLSPPPTALFSNTQLRHESVSTLIGNIYRNEDTGAYFYQCCNRRCSDRSFRRLYDLGRHHDGRHSSEGPRFWCIVPGCDRSAAVGGRSFPRKDKLSDHVRKVHGAVPQAKLDSHHDHI
jgi:hypothetical protein